MEGQFGFAHLLWLALVAVATIAVHTKLRRMGQPVWAVIASLAGLGLMICMII